MLIGNKVDREAERRVSRQRALQWCKSKGSTVRMCGGDRDVKSLESLMYELISVYCVCVGPVGGGHKLFTL